MGLNLALHTGDVKPCVMMNRSIVTQCCPSDEPKWLTQVHGTTVLCADDIDSAQPAPKTDAQWTSTKQGCGLRDDGRLSARLHC